MLHKHLSSIESSTPRRPISEQLPLPGMAPHQTVRVLYRPLSAHPASAAPGRFIRLRTDTLDAAFEIVQRAPGRPESTNREMERQRIKRLVIATALTMESGASHG